MNGGLIRKQDYLKPQVKKQSSCQISSYNAFRLKALKISQCKPKQYILPPCMYLVQTTKTTRVGRPSHIFKVLTKVINCGSLPNWLSNAIVQKPSYSNGCTWRVVGPSNNSTVWQQQQVLCILIKQHQSIIQQVPLEQS